MSGSESDYSQDQGIFIGVFIIALLINIGGVVLRGMRSPSAVACFCMKLKRVPSNGREK